MSITGLLDMFIENNSLDSGRFLLSMYTAVTRGASPLEQKPELQKELERRKLDKQRKEVLEQQSKNRTSFEQKLDQQYVKVAAVSMLC